MVGVSHRSIFPLVENPCVSAGDTIELNAIVLIDRGADREGSAIEEARFVFEDGATTFTVVVIRTLVATAAVVAIGIRGGLRVGRQAWIDGAVIGLLRIGLAPIFFIASLNYISAGFESLGRHALRGVGEPLELFALRDETG